jgi:hypothetical protein
MLGKKDQMLLKKTDAESFIFIRQCAARRRAQHANHPPIGSSGTLAG